MGPNSGHHLIYLMKTLPLSEVKSKLSKLVNQVEDLDEEVFITRNGKVAGVLISLDEYESWKETLAIRADKDLMREIRRGLKGLRRNRKTYTLNELFESIS